jgi:hypothetical protein
VLPLRGKVYGQYGHPRPVVRTGLILIGVSLAIVGAGVITAVTTPVPSPPVTQSRSASLVNFTSSSRQFDVFHVPAVSFAEISFDWNATGPMSVILSHAIACDSPLGWCEQGTPLVFWTSEPLGAWKGSGPTTSLYALQFLSDSPSGNVSFNATFAETYRTLGPALPAVPYALAVAGGGVLLGIGALGTYLGLFLPPNPLRSGRRAGDPELDPALVGPDADPAAIQDELKFHS